MLATALCCKKLSVLRKTEDDTSNCFVALRWPLSGNKGMYLLGVLGLLPKVEKKLLYPHYDQILSGQT